MEKWWSVLFGVTMLACLALFVAAPVVGWWLPEGVSTHSWDIDVLFYVILYITGFFFILTEGLLVVFMFKFAGQPGQKGPPPATSPSRVGKMLKPFTGIIHNEHRLELAWTIVPAIILLVIAFIQVGAWTRVKYQSRMNEYMEAAIPIQVEVSARQFEWRIRYPSSERLDGWIKDKVDLQKDVDFKSFAKVRHQDDVHVVNELHVIKGRPVLVQLKTIDVLHSFNIPVMRVKQDALPGKVIPVWFTPTKANTKKNGSRWEDGYNSMTKLGSDSTQVWEIACAELCGWGHFRMIGRVYVHEDKADFDAWLKQAEENQRTKVSPIKLASR